ncbi:DNA-entry nuclease [Companilactobacillus halodurans]|uniref:DNA-entry nuclease n=1 Tax=Companilactobacillus halodurans TaxID=2584183 RepID=A0A5P0ZM72_9LACO|nr:DNA-entry nuclease [Companilactobacillus halodurans]MQS75276.1 DNA-entry nuclease [Companilactobacillus halodurans]MQS97625.1 DNA-entry nuclease [Companilactobacillus halodurans]
MTVLIGLIAFFAMIYFAIKLINQHKVRNKTRTGKAIKKKYRIGLFSSLIILIVAFASGGGTTEEKVSHQDQKNEPRTSVVATKTKYVGKSKYKIVKKEHVALVAQKNKLKEQEDSLQEQRDQIEDKEKQEQEEQQQQQEQAQKQQEEQQKQAQQQAQQQQEKQNQQQETQQRGDMTTSQSGKIVGNSNSHIYHVPGQRGYKMNSSNAVYFDNEQDAINAGYRKAKV